MNGDSFIKIYIKHIQNICKGKLPLPCTEIEFTQHRHKGEIEEKLREPERATRKDSTSK